LGFINISIIFYLISKKQKRNFFSLKPLHHQVLIKTKEKKKKKKQKSFRCPRPHLLGLVRQDLRQIHLLAFCTPSFLQFYTTVLLFKCFA